MVLFKQKEVDLSKDVAHLDLVHPHTGQEVLQRTLIERQSLSLPVSPNRPEGTRGRTNSSENEVNELFRFLKTGEESAREAGASNNEILFLLCE